MPFLLCRKQGRDFDICPVSSYSKGYYFRSECKFESHLGRSTEGPVHMVNVLLYKSRETKLYSDECLNVEG